MSILLEFDIYGLEQRLSDITSRRGAGEAGEHRASDMLNIFVQPVALRKLLLKGDELLLQIALEADKEQSGIQLAGLGVNPPE